MLKQDCKPLFTQSINFAYESEDDKEEAYLHANPSMIPILEVDAEAIVNSIRMLRHYYMLG